MEIEISNESGLVLKSQLLDEKCNGMATLMLNEASFGNQEFDYDLTLFYGQLLEGVRSGCFAVDCLFDISHSTFEYFFDKTYGEESLEPTESNEQLVEFFRLKDDVVFTYGDYGLDECLVGFLQKGDLEKLIVIDHESGSSGSIVMPRGSFEKAIGKMYDKLQLTCS
ncbi:hypothetical protein [Alteromonas confluentis]|uniref:Uncharacterized protein n=1 Tax=Alteromonas confluentis TaxID=1656094 RepID=A0A1E7ZGU6_9ALTE|nr:hypothetical protein [Alteromonas confluentis]OFC72690.1 hypothetical protein BFC18_02240 [Alteromonas confluentis]